MQDIDDLVAQLRLLPESLMDESFLASDEAIISMWNRYHTASPKLLLEQVKLIRMGAFTQYADLCRMIHPFQLDPSYAYFLARYGGATFDSPSRITFLYGIGTLSEYMYAHILESEGLPPYQHGYLPIGDHSQVQNTRLIMYALKQQSIFEIPYTHDLMPFIHAFEQHQNDLIQRTYSSFEDFLSSLIPQKHSG